MPIPLIVDFFSLKRSNLQNQSLQKTVSGNLSVKSSTRLSIQKLFPAIIIIKTKRINGFITSALLYAGRLEMHCSRGMASQINVPYTVILTALHKLIQGFNDKPLTGEMSWSIITYF